MFSKLGKTIVDKNLINELTKITLGVEVERDRTTTIGHLSDFAYPHQIGDEKTNPWITTDFLEAMTETVTPPFASESALHDCLTQLTRIVRSSLSSGEILWPLSMPPILPTSHFADYLAKAKTAKRKYIEKLCQRYGFAKQTPCGVHVNVSLSNQLIQQLVEVSDFKTPRDVQNYVYPLIAQGFIKYRWILTYLFGASPVAQANYFPADQELKRPVRSIRQSKYGYPKSFEVDYSNVHNYVQRIMKAISNHTIMSPAEFYGAVRFKGAADLHQLEFQGVKYIELRMMDLAPTSEIAIKPRTIRLIKLMMLYFVMVEPISNADLPNELHLGNQINNQVAVEYPTDVSEFKTAGIAFLGKLRQLIKQFNLESEYLKVIEDCEAAFSDPKLTISGQLLPEIKNNSLVDFGIQQAKKYQKQTTENQVPVSPFVDAKRVLTAEELRQTFHLI